MREQMEHPIVLFDGVCNLCDASVHFVINRDRTGRIRFAPLQSEAGQALLNRFGLAGGDLDTMVLIEGDRIHTRSTAALRVARMLRLPWPLLAVFLLVPRVVRDVAYRAIARRRYRWFGRTEKCRVPTPELRERFLA